MCTLAGFTVTFLMMVLGAVFGITAWTMVVLLGLLGFVYLTWMADQQQI